MRSCLQKIKAFASLTSEKYITAVWLVIILVDNISELVIKIVLIAFFLIGF